MIRKINANHLHLKILRDKKEFSQGKGLSGVSIEENNRFLFGIKYHDSWYVWLREAGSSRRAPPESGGFFLSYLYYAAESHRRYPANPGAQYGGPADRMSA